MGNAVKIFKHFETPKDEGVYFRLICLTGQSKGMAYFLIGNRAVLGRSENADVRVLDIKSSREHADITKVGKNYVVTDLNSQNGIVVNDLKVKQHKLKNGDKIIIGQTVYKFSRIEVKPKISVNEYDDDDDEYEDEESPKNNKRVLILAIIAIVGIFIIIGEDGESTKTTKSRRKNTRYNYNEIDNNSFKDVVKKKVTKNKKLQKQLDTYFQRGLREFREGNYFRAMNQFDLADKISPNDTLAAFYLSKTRKALDKEVQRHFVKARRDIKSLKFRKAIIGYCAVIRLLENYKNDKNLELAHEGIKKMEIKMGYEPGSIECIKKG